MKVKMNSWGCGSPCSCVEIYVERVDGNGCPITTGVFNAGDSDELETIGAFVKECAAVGIDLPPFEGAYYDWDGLEFDISEDLLNVVERTD